MGDAAFVLGWAHHAADLFRMTRIFKRWAWGDGADAGLPEVLRGRMRSWTAVTGTSVWPAGSGAMLAVLLGGQAMATMDSSIVNVAVQSIRVHLPASGAQLQLVSAGYLLAFAVLVVPGARLGDRYGHGRMFRVGLGVFTAASLGCGLAPSAAALVAARILQGAAAALMVPQVISLIQMRFDGRTRSRAIGLYSMVLALGVAGGQVLGGVVVTADLYGLAWRMALLINVPVGLVLLAVAARSLPADAAPSVVRLDLAGVAVLSVSMVAIVAPLVFGRAESWPAWCAASLVAGGAGVAVFVWYERLVLRGGRAPLVDFRAVNASGVRSGLAACVLVMGAYSAFFFSLTLHLQGGLGFSPLAAGLTVLPFAGGFATLSLAWTRLPAAAARVMPVLGPLLFAFGLTATVMIDNSAPGWPTGPAIGLLFAAGAGHSAAYSPLFARVAALVSARYASALSALETTGALLAGAVSIAGLAGFYLAAAESAGAQGNVAVASQQGLTRVTVAVDITLLLTAACALWTVTRPSPSPQQTPGRRFWGRGRRTAAAGVLSASAARLRRAAPARKD